MLSSAAMAALTMCPAVSQWTRSATSVMFSSRKAGEAFSSAVTCGISSAGARPTKPNHRGGGRRSRCWSWGRLCRRGVGSMCSCPSVGGAAPLSSARHRARAGSENATRARFLKTNTRTCNSVVVASRQPHEGFVHIRKQLQDQRTMKHYRLYGSGTRFKGLST
jgi:hypothetical protein